MKTRILYCSLIFVLISCGGGSSSPPNTIDNNATPQTSEVCIPYSINTKRCTFTHDNLERYYLIYEPASLSQDYISAPLLFALHGYGSSAGLHKSYTGYEALAEENKFIVVYPQGYKLESTLTNSSSHWNVGAWTIDSNINDVDFIDSVINLVDEKVDIDKNRIYSSGMSNGGFMSYHLACNLSIKIAAIASVTGSMSRETLSDCSPSHPTAVLQIHGLQDSVVPYNGNDFVGMEPVDDVLDYWANYNNCNPDRLWAVADYPNENGSVDFIHYESCINNVDVRLIRIPRMGHTWPSIDAFNISASEEIWNFLSQFDLDGKISN